MKIMQVALLCACAAAGQAWAAPVFQLGTDNNLGFQSVGNKSGTGSFAVGDIIYGVINVQDISTGSGSTGTTLWNANNVSSNPPIDSFSGYYLAQVKTVTPITSSAGTFYSVQLGAASSDPNGKFSAADLTAGMMMKLYTDTATVYTTGGPVAADIAHATDGAYWGGLGITPTGNGYWNLAVSPSSFSATSSSFGGLDFINNNSGLSWAKVLDTNCAASSGCAVDMKFAATFSQSAGGAWQIDSNDPATLHPVPLPASAWLMGSGMLALAGLPIRRKKRPSKT